MRSAILFLAAVIATAIISPHSAEANETFRLAQAVPNSGTSGPLAPAGVGTNAGRDHCISYLARNGAFWGNPNNTSWQPQNAVWLCENNLDFASPPEPVRCFAAQMSALNNWEEAIGTCRVARGLAFGAPGQGQVSNQATASPVASPIARGNLAGVPGANISVSLRNELGQPVDVYFIDGTGEGQYLQEIGANATLSLGSVSGTELVFALDGDEFASYLTDQAAQQSFVISRAADTQVSQASTATQAAPGSPKIHGGALLQGPPIPGSSASPAGTFSQGGANGGFVPGQPTIISNQGLGQNHRQAQGQLGASLPAGPPVLGLGSVLEKIARNFVRNEQVDADCAETREASEQVICQHDELAALQVGINSNYEFLNGELSPREKAILIADHQNWIATRNACARNVSCLQLNLYDRSSYLSEYLHTGD